MIGAQDALVVAAAVGGTAALGAALGALVLRRLRQASLAASVAVVIGTAALVMGAAVLVLGRLMLVSGDAATLLAVVVVAAALAAGLVAAVLARRVTRGSRDLVARAVQVGEGRRPEPGRLPDTRELRALDAALTAAADRLAESRERETAIERARRELVAWVSHDLRSPVAGLLAMAEALEDGVLVDPETVAEYHRRMRRETVRLSGMIDDLFELSGIQAGAVPVRRREVALAEVVDEVAQAAEPVAAARGVRVVAQVGPAVALADPDQLARAVRNLVGNAVRHTPEGGTVVVAVVVDGGAAGIAVSDECGGIPESDLPRVFEVGFRGEHARTPGAGAGAGIGLAITQGIVDAHRGSVDVVNTGPGCRFTLRLPAAGAVPARGA